MSDSRSHAAHHNKHFNGHQSGQPGALRTWGSNHDDEHHTDDEWPELSSTDSSDASGEMSALELATLGGQGRAKVEDEFGADLVDAAGAGMEMAGCLAVQDAQHDATGAALAAFAAAPWKAFAAVKSAGGSDADAATAAGAAAATAAATQWMKGLDADGDGEMSLEEAKAAGFTEEQFNAMDIDHDGHVTLGEVAKSAGGASPNYTPKRQGKTNRERAAWRKSKMLKKNAVKAARKKAHSQSDASGESGSESESNGGVGALEEWRRAEAAAISSESSRQKKRREHREARTKQKEAVSGRPRTGLKSLTCPTTSFCNEAFHRHPPGHELHESAEVEVDVPQDIYFACAVAIIHRDRVSNRWRLYIIFLALTCEFLQFASFAGILARVIMVDIFPCPLGGSACPAYDAGTFCSATPHTRQGLEAFPEGAGMCLGCSRPLAVSWCNETREQMESYPHLYSGPFDWNVNMFKYFSGTSARNMTVGDIQNMCEECTPTRYGKQVSFRLNNGTEVQYSDHADQPQWNVGKMLIHDWIVLFASGAVVGLALGTEQHVNFKTMIATLYPWACTGTGTDGHRIHAPPPQSRYVTYCHYH